MAAKKFHFTTILYTPDFVSSSPMALASKSLENLFSQMYPELQGPQKIRTLAPLDIRPLIDHWQDLLGEKIAQQAYPQSITRKTLIIICKHTVEAYELNFYAQKILDSIYAKLPTYTKKIKAVRFVPHYSEFLELEQYYNSTTTPTPSSAPGIVADENPGFHPKSPIYPILEAMARHFVKNKDIQGVALIKSLSQIYIHSLAQSPEDRKKIDALEFFITQNNLEYVKTLFVDEKRVFLLLKNQGKEGILKLFFDETLGKMEEYFFSHYDYFAMSLWEKNEKNGMFFYQRPTTTSSYSPPLRKGKLPEKYKEYEKEISVHLMEKYPLAKTPYSIHSKAWYVLPFLKEDPQGMIKFLETVFLPKEKINSWDFFGLLFTFSVQEGYGDLAEILGKYLLL